MHVVSPDREFLPDKAEGLHFHACDIRAWPDLRRVFEQVGRVDFVFANAGMIEATDFLSPEETDISKLEEPSYDVLQTNVFGVLSTVKLAWATMRAHGTAGSIVITTSSTAYAPEQSLPLLAAGKAATVGLVRALRSLAPQDGITINAVAPAATVTGMLPQEYASAIEAQGLPVSSSHFVGLALVHSATAMQGRKVQVYGRETEACALFQEERWNGRVLLTIGNRCTEIEEPLADLRRFWLGEENLRLTTLQQASTDLRANVAKK